MSIEPYRRKDGLISYSYKFRWHGRTYRGHIGPVSLRQAKLAELQAKVLAAEGKHPLPKRQQRRQASATVAAVVPTFLEFAPQFLASYAVDARERSVRTYTDRLNLHLLPYFADLRLDQATTATIDAYRMARRQEGAAARTINGELATLSCLLRKAVELGLIPKALLPLIRWLRVEEKPVRVLSDEEEARLLMSATPHLRPLVTFALQTGLRKMELLMLTWADIDLPRREVTVVALRAKNRHRRVVPLNREAIAALKEAHTRHARVFGYHSVSAPMDRAAKQAGMAGVNMHTFRRTFATRLLEHTDIDTVRRLLGHSSLLTTQKYLGASPDHARQAVEWLAKPTKHQQRSPI